MQIVVLANDFTIKNSKYYLTNFKNQSKVENLLSFYSKKKIYSTKATKIKDNTNKQCQYQFFQRFITARRFFIFNFYKVKFSFSYYTGF
jgi:hypothetical protein